MQENEKLCDLEKQVGKHIFIFPYVELLFCESN